MKEFYNWIMGGGLFGIFTFQVHSQFQTDQKISKVYKRFDEYKKLTEERFVDNKICTVVREANARQFSELRETLMQVISKLDRLIEKK